MVPQSFPLVFGLREISFKTMLSSISMRRSGKNVALTQQIEDNKSVESAILKQILLFALPFFLFSRLTDSTDVVSSFQCLCDCLLIRI